MLEIKHASRLTHSRGIELEGPLRANASRGRNGPEVAAEEEEVAEEEIKEFA